MKHINLSHNNDIDEIGCEIQTHDELNKLSLPIVAHSKLNLNFLFDAIKLTKSEALISMHFNEEGHTVDNMRKYTYNANIKWEYYVNPCNKRIYEHMIKGADMDMDPNSLNNLRSFPQDYPLAHVVYTGGKNISQLLQGLSMLKLGGTMICVFNDITSMDTIAIIYLLNKYFEGIILYYDSVYSIACINLQKHANMNVLYKFYLKKNLQITHVPDEYIKKIHKAFSKIKDL